MAGRDIPAATAVMKTTARHAGALWGSGGVVTVWSRVCAWVRVFPVAGDGLGLHAPIAERHGRTARPGGEQRKNQGLTVGVGVEWIAVQWRVVAV